MNSNSKHSRPRNNQISHLPEIFRSYQSRVEAALDAQLPPRELEPIALHSAMRDATLNGGKRIRSMLAYAAGNVTGAEPALVDIPACAVELIHAYSLVHDDLPAMDDDDLRRGKPSCHIVYGEAVAILAGDALQSLAFELLAGPSSLEPEKLVSMTSILAQATGSRGMAGGQAMDIGAQGQSLKVDELKQLHMGKTGALIQAAVSMGALCGPKVNSDILDILDEFAMHIGLAFQVVDDILDEESDTETLGKTSGVDRALEKATYPSTLGIEASRDLAGELEGRALSALEKLGPQTHLLRQVAGIVIRRSY